MVPFWLRDARILKHETNLASLQAEPIPLAEGNNFRLGIINNNHTRHLSTASLSSSTTQARMGEKSLAWLMPPMFYELWISVHASGNWSACFNAVTF